MTMEDVFSRCSWGPFDSALLSYYEFSLNTDREKRELYTRWRQMKRLWYSFDLSRQGGLAAILSLRDIHRFSRSSRLGLVVKPEYVNRGYGTEIIRGFMKYYFEVMKYRTLCLDVADFNKRALHCYTKCGFSRCGSFEREFPGRFELMNTAEFKKSAGCFTIRKNRIYAHYTDMKISRKDWKQRISQK